MIDLMMIGLLHKDKSSRVVAFLLHSAKNKALPREGALTVGRWFIICIGTQG